MIEIFQENKYSYHSISLRLWNYELKLIPIAFYFKKTIGKYDKITYKLRN